MDRFLRKGSPARKRKGSPASKRKGSPAPKRKSSPAPKRKSSPVPKRKNSPAPKKNGATASGSTGVKITPGETRMRKLFGDGEYYDGTVVSIEERTEDEETTTLYGIAYDDDDSEELELDELIPLIQSYEKHMNKTSKSQSPKKNGSKMKEEKDASSKQKEPLTVTSRSGRKTKAVSYQDGADLSDDEDEMSVESMNEDDNDDIENKKPKRGQQKGKKATEAKNGRKRKSSSSPSRGRKTIKSGRRSKGKTSSSDSDVSVASFPSSDDEGEPEFLAVSTKEKKPPQATKKGGQGQKEKVSMADAFAPTNNPLFKGDSWEEMKANYSYLDPCGMEATDDIIGGLVGRMVEKLGPLLPRSLSNSKSHTIGTRENPLKLGTACSGTDAPALALGMVQEQMNLRGMKDLFHFDHQFSCEVEPFKQAYLARNFDSVLYPDIAKLTGKEPRDVYQQVKPLPPMNIFVAGTSCKNFSMLMSKFRIDIEDKGCSGETFLAATEVLFQEKPQFAILENVTSAPWEKMSEYITGRVNISNSQLPSAKGKQIKSDNKKEGKELTFEWNDKEDKVSVFQVPATFGVRCGAPVKGFMESHSKKLQKLSWSNKSKKTFTLRELLKSNGLEKATGTLVFDLPVTYCTKHIKVDSKKFGVPQTRERVYMFVWQPEKENFDDDLGDYWEAVVRHLECHVRHSLEAFMLQVDHDIIRVFREALRGPAGRHTKRSIFQEPDFWNGSSANKKHNLIARERSGIKELARPQTKWGPYGAKQVPPHYWLEYLDCENQRVMDMLDILHISAARDAETHDSNMSSFFWNLSQNVSKEKHRSKIPGIAGCITPGGDVFLPHQGRPVLGCEKLLAQAIPYFSLNLGNETEVQLGDLAGNAMTLTVVCSTLLGAMVCHQLRDDTMASKHKDKKQILEECIQKGKSLEEFLKAPKPKVPMDGSKDFSSVLKELALLSNDATECSILCTCETSGQNSIAKNFLQCKICRVSCCRECCHGHSGYQLDGHDIEEKTFNDVETRALVRFEKKIRSCVPPTLTFMDDDSSDLALLDDEGKQINHLLGRLFSLHRIRRQRRHWIITYYTRDNVGENIGEFKLRVGEIKTDSKSHSSCVEFGVLGEFTSFLPAKSKNPTYGPLAPGFLIKAVKKDESVEIGDWMVKTPSQTHNMTVVGSGVSESFRADLGLTNLAAQSLQQYAEMKRQEKDFAKAKMNGQERRFIYAKNWKEWPKTIEITLDKEDQLLNELYLSGTYERANCKQTVTQNALWIKKEGGAKPTRYLLMMPDVSRTGPDFAVMSSSLSYEDKTCVIATFPLAWQPCDALVEKHHLVKGVSISTWTKLSALKCSAPDSTISVSSTGDTKSFVTVSGLSNSEVAMLCAKSSDETSKSKDSMLLDWTCSRKGQQRLRSFDAICSAPILKYAASSDFPFDLSSSAKWVPIEAKKGEAALGCCEKILPPKPTELWQYNEDRSWWERLADPGASRTYYQALQDSPKSFEFWLKKGSLEVRLNPSVTAHHAAGNLIQGRGGDMSKEIQVQYRLSDVQSQPDPILKQFRVHKCENEVPIDVPLMGGHKLYMRQQKAVAKMLAIEEGNTTFEEMEMSEHTMPGSVGWSCMARATRQANISGGVIADAIGAGKTVISIAIILNGLERAKAARQNPRNSSATLVVVPPALIDQWKSEIDKFAGDLKVVCIYDFKSFQKIMAVEILDADCVITTVDLLSHQGYIDNLVQKSKKSGVKSFEVPKFPSMVGQKELNGAKGVWLASTGADPYGLGLTHHSQERREEAARFTYVYLNSIATLRTKSFGLRESGVPLEYFEWERVIVDEVHESLCTAKGDFDKKDDFTEKKRRAGRELLGITTKDVSKRPLVYRKAIYGLTGTPLLDSSDRVIELANLMGNTYVIGLSSHWRKLEKESGRDIFLHNYLEPKTSREIRSNVYKKCQDYLVTACCRNKIDDEMAHIKRVDEIKKVQMTVEEVKLYKDSQHGIPTDKRALDIQPGDFDPTAGHDISKFLKQNANLPSRGKALVEVCREILSGDPKTKIIVFCDGRINAGEAARKALASDPDLGCTWLKDDDTVQTKNQKISWYQYPDITSEDNNRPRILVLNFEHAAGLNLQKECFNLVLFTPLYVGEGGTTDDPVTDVSTELQAIGRVHRPGQTRREVFVHRICVEGPDGEECLDGHLIRRNTDEETAAMATNSDESV